MEAIILANSAPKEAGDDLSSSLLLCLMAYFTNSAYPQAETYRIVLEEVEEIVTKFLPFLGDERENVEEEDGEFIWRDKPCVRTSSKVWISSLLI